MAKVTSKYQVTIPKALAEEHRIKPGDEIEWSSAGESIRIQRSRSREDSESFTAKVQRFDEATGRQKRRRKRLERVKGDRGWTREDLYDRGRPH